MEVDPISFIEEACVISSPQKRALSGATVAREEEFFEDDDVDGVNDIWPESSDDDGGGAALADPNLVGITFCSPPPTPQPDQNDGVSGNNSVDLGFSTDTKRVRENEIPASPPPTAKKLRFSGENDGENTTVFSDESDELGFRGERKRMREESETVSPPTATAEKLSIPGVVSVSSSDGGSEVAEGENPPVYGGGTVEIEDVVSEEWESPVNCTKEVNLSDDDDDGDIATVVIAEEEAAAEDVTVDRRKSKAETCGNAMECVIQVLGVLSNEKRREIGGGGVDFFETAKRRGYTFPPPRVLPQ